MDKPLADRNYRVPAATVRTEMAVKGSRFIATVQRVRSAQEVAAFIAAVRKEFPDASHNCSAFCAGAPGDSNHVGMNDDGEPSGTAGRPMLTALLHSGIGEIAVVVTRYFGGTKLGQGGLVRAYTQAVQQALADTPTEELVHWTRFDIALDYSDLEKTKILIQESRGEIDAIDYTDKVCIGCRIPHDMGDEFEERFREATCGRGRVQSEGEGVSPRGGP